MKLFFRIKLNREKIYLLKLTNLFLVAISLTFALILITPSVLDSFAQEENFQCSEGMVLVYRINSEKYACLKPSTADRWYQEGIAEPVKQIKSFDGEIPKLKSQIESQHLQTFDELDFDIFTNQKWDRLHESHSQDIIVHWPDGRITEGIEPHIEDLKAMFVYAPDTRIEQHPIRIASGQWTSVIGVIEGTFTEPMPLPDGSSIEPTGKSFRLTMNTVGYWEDGVMTEEYLFWDNLEFMKQIGLF